MAQKNRPALKLQALSKPVSKSKSHKPQSSLSRIILFVFMILFILTSGFAVGVYLNLIDLHKIGNTYKLYEYPFLNKYFPKPQTNFETIVLEEQQPKGAGASAILASPSVIQQPPVTEKKEDNQLDLERELKNRQQDEQKKLSKMARLYGAMKPEEAVIILNQLDDQTVLSILNRMEDDQVSRILTLFETKKAAQITKEMIKTKPANSR